MVFEEGTDIYFARNLINERLGAIKSALPPGLEPEMGPIATGLGEIFMYTVEALPGATQADGSPLDATALREIQDWIIKPQLAQVPGVIEVNTIGGYDKQYHVTRRPNGCWSSASRWMNWSAPCGPITPIAAPAISNATANSCWCARPGSWPPLAILNRW